MVKYSVDLETGPLVKKLKRLGRDMPEINRGILGDLADAVVTRADSKYLSGGRPNLRRPTGHLAQSLTYRVGKDFAEVGTNLVYAAIHEFGGTIKPKNGQYLKFEINGKTIFAKQVTIPARPYLKPALNDIFASGKAQLIADRELQRQIDKRV